MRVLMCPPTEYRIAWEINPWMKKSHQPNRERAWRQWHRVFELYQKLALRIHLIQPVAGLSDFIFTANAGWGRKGTFILSNFRYTERRKEQPYFKTWLQQHGFRTLRLPKNIFFEGQGDLITTKEAYLLGWGIRSSLEAAQEIKKRLGLQKQIVPLRLINPKFYHLDTCLMYIQPINTILYYPPAFHKKSLAQIQKLEVNTIEVTKKEAEAFICNGIYYRDSVILPVMSNRIEKRLRKLGLEVLFSDVSEFRKSGAGLRCLTLFLD